MEATTTISKRESIFYKVTLFCAYSFIFCVVSVFSVINYLVVVRNESFQFTESLPWYAVFTFAGVGFFFLICMLWSLTGYVMARGKKQHLPLILHVLLAGMLTCIFPVYLLAYILQPLTFLQFCISRKLPPFNGKVIGKKIGYSLVVLGVLLPIWIGGYFLIGMAGQRVLGYATDEIAISGTGSMYPTFPKGEGKDAVGLSRQVVDTPGMFPYPNGLAIAGKRYFGHTIGRGDIVVIENEKIRNMTAEMFGTPSGWVKRVIGLPGDELELRAGIVYLNNQPLREPYTARPQSTFGQEFLTECKKVTVPKDSLFVMGDNRKGSGDSREIGFIQIRAVNHVLPLADQKGVLDTYWRDTANDFNISQKITLDKNKYLALLNEKRKEAGVKALVYQPKLETSARKRGEVILKFDDFSFEATKSGYTMSKAMNDAGYYNIVYGEAPRQGYYEAEELIDNQFEFPETKIFLTDKTYQEFGIAEVEGTINGCPTQIIVQHFAGYVPPNYKKSDIDSWKKSLEKLREVQPGWNSLKEESSFYQKYKNDIDRLNTIIDTRIGNMTAIIARMEANQWLTTEERRMIDTDEGLYNEQQSLAEKLNSAE